MTRKHLTYAQAGVSIARGDRLVRRIKPFVRPTLSRDILSSVGGFGALARIPRRYRSPLLVVGTDGVGTKVRLAVEMKTFHTVGIDLVAMSVNDVLTLGAQPFLFLDYFATGKLRLSRGVDIVRGVARGCRLAGCALVGGETAEMPQVYRGEDFDLAGFCLGLVEAGKVIDGRSIRSGDSLIGIPSSGIHSNGYSLVRRILKKRRLSLRSRPPVFRGQRLGDVLLKPTRIYAREVVPLLQNVPVHGMVHVTGGGIVGNLPRILPKGVEAEVNRKSWHIPPLFHFLQEQGCISNTEMFRTFNMGIGFILVVPASSVARVCHRIRGARVIGRICDTSNAPRVRWA